MDLPHSFSPPDHTDQTREQKTIYHISKINCSERETRVIHLLPGPWDDEIRCELHTISLNAQPIYEALSYVWGNPDITREILLDGIGFKVRRNLAAALRRLRNQTKTRVIWIDASTMQVRIMGAIYENCKEVFLWLGDEPNPQPPEIRERPFPWFSDSKEDDLENLINDPRLEHDIPFAGFLVFYMLSRNKHSHETPCFKQSAKGPLYLRLPILQKGLELLVFSEWWNRIWTVQEAILPKKATLVLGSVMAPLNLLVDAEIASGIHSSSQCCNRTMAQNLLGALNFAYGKIFCLHSASSARKEKSNPFLFDLMWDFCPQNASDDRDKVFGLLGLVPTASVDSEIAPDYSMTTEELYTRVMLHFLIKYESLFALELCTRNKCGLPSWVFDWSDRPKLGQSNGRRGKRRAILEVYDLSRHNAFIASLSDELLHLHAFKLGTISSCSGETLIRKRQKKVPTSEDLQNLAGFEAKPTRQYRDGNDSWEDAYWRTLCGDVWRVGFDDQGFSLYQKIGPKGRLVYQNWCLFMNGVNFSDDSETSEIMLFHNIARRITHKRKFFVSTEGFLGLGPLDMCPGDELYLVQGARVPFVLRKYSLSDELPRETFCLPGPVFTLIGNCYVHGIMFGEIYDKRDIVFEDIILA
ncbi:HET domain containing protein [Hyaloscypha variabilis]